MVKLGLKRRERGFSFLEMCVVVAILAIIIALGTINITQQKRARVFSTNVDKLVAVLQQAQTAGRAYGTGPTPPSGFTFESTTGVPTSVTNYIYRFRIMNNAMGPDFSTTEEFRDLYITTNFGFKIPDDDDLDDLMGTVLLITFADDVNASQNKQALIYFGPNGVPGYPAMDTADPAKNYVTPGSALMNSHSTDESYWIGVRNVGKATEGPKYVRRISINKNNGTISRQRANTSSPDFSNESHWEADS